MIPASRSRRRVGALLLVTVALGLASRRRELSWPPFVTMYAGDALWAAMMFWLLALLRPGARTRELAAAALCIAFVVEWSQLYHAPWLDGLRGTRIGALVLGQGFLISDLWCYTVGVAMAAMVDRIARAAPRANAQAH